MDIEKNNLVIYCDESGYTGNDLLAKEQPTFVFSSVAIDPHEAQDLVLETKRRFKIQMPELKASGLVKSKRGHKAIDWLLPKLVDSGKTLVANKKFALAGKFFEYVIEPTLKSHHSLLYGMGLHLFVSNLLYAAFLVQDASAEQIFNDFQSVLRGRGTIAGNALSSIFVPGANKSLYVQSSGTNPIDDIVSICLCNHKDVLREIEGAMRSTGGDWLLDLSFTALFTLLSDWGSNSQQVEVYCDNSKPLAAMASTFDFFVGRERKKISLDYINSILPGRFSSAIRTELTRPNLTNQIQFVDSATTHGLQLADVLAGTTAFVSNSEPSEFLDWKELCQRAVVCGIGPEEKWLNPDKLECFVLASVITWIKERTIRGESVGHGLEERIFESIRWFESEHKVDAM